MYMTLLQHVSSVIYTPIQRHLELKCNFVDSGGGTLSMQIHYLLTSYIDTVTCNSILLKLHCNSVCPLYIQYSLKMAVGYS